MNGWYEHKPTKFIAHRPPGSVLSHTNRPPIVLWPELMAVLGAPFRSVFILDPARSINQENSAMEQPKEQPEVLV